MAGLMSKAFQTALAVFVAFLALSTAPAAANSKYAAIVVHADSGDVLFSRYADKRLYPASLTKMMTLYLLFEELEAGELTLQSELKVSVQAAGQPPSKLGVAAGSTIDVETAIKALIVKSANDVAVVVAESISGAEWKFAKKMTEKARELGMRNTTFANASGLPNRRMLTTARDLSILSRRVIQDFPQYYELFDTKSFTWSGRTDRTHNRLVKTYEGADGLKTGYTRRSGYNLATSAQRDGNRLIGIVLGGRSGQTRDAHMAEILTASFNRIGKKPALIAALHRTTPTPNLKPGLEPVVRLAAGVPAPSLAAARTMADAIASAAGEMSVASAEDGDEDQISALIAASAIGLDDADVTDDLNEFEQMRLAALDPDEEMGQGDIDALALEHWDVQIGAFRNKRLAIDELERIATDMKLAEFARMVAPMAGPDGATYYRARFVALSEMEARAACDLMRAAEQACIVVNGSDAR